MEKKIHTYHVYIRIYMVVRLHVRMYMIMCVFMYVYGECIFSLGCVCQA